MAKKSILKLQRYKPHNTTVSIDRGEEDSGRKNENRKDKPTSVINDNLMVKKVNSPKLNRDLQNKHDAIVKFFGDAKPQCMEDYINLTMNQYFVHIILHCSKNSSSLEKNPESIAKNIITLAKKGKPSQVNSSS